MRANAAGCCVSARIAPRSVRCEKIWPKPTNHDQIRLHLRFAQLILRATRVLAGIVGSDGRNIQYDVAEFDGGRESVGHLQRHAVLQPFHFHVRIVRRRESRLEMRPLAVVALQRLEWLEELRRRRHEQVHGHRLVHLAVLHRLDRGQRGRMQRVGGDALLGGDLENGVS